MTAETVLLISGSLRAASTNSAVIRTAAALVGADAKAHVYTELGALPHFDPDVEAVQPPEIVNELRRAIDASSAMLICTPEYAGSLPGTFKNLLDWTIGGNEVAGKPTAWINASGNATKAAGAHAMLRTVLTYTGANIVEEACRHIPIGRADIGPDGEVATQARRDEIQEAFQALLTFSRTTVQEL
ncbi:NADPH-dependent FMN reductase [Nocardia sp. 004]|uniref:NADPH-dependent FMN reductase n=1 Tax=Nocardia sp. 004 TaxID=3385978 RepID=UPI00399FBBEE